MHTPIDYLDPKLPPGLAPAPIPVVDATAETPAAATDISSPIPTSAAIEIVRWPAQGTRPVDADTGDQGGTTEGVFVSEWDGDILYGRNEAVGGHYILAYAVPPERARTGHAEPAAPDAARGTRTTTPTAGSSSSRWTRGRSTCRWRCRATT